MISKTETPLAPVMFCYPKMRSQTARGYAGTGTSRRTRKTGGFPSILLSAALFTLLTVPAGAGDYMSPAMTPLELQQRLESGNAPLVVDLRAPVEFKIAHIPGAVNIPVTELEKRLDEVSGDAGVLIYCINGARTLQAEPLLYTRGIDNVYHLEGSLQAWIKGNFPIEKGGPEKTSW